MEKPKRVFDSHHDKDHLPKTVAKCLMKVQNVGIFIGETGFCHGGIFIISKKCGDILFTDEKIFRMAEKLN